MLALVAMRLYEDVLRSEGDSIDRLKLPLLLILVISAISWMTEGLDLTMVWVYYFVVNHILYKALGHRRFWSFALPALQYPILLLALTFSFWNGMVDMVFFISAISIFLIALVYQKLEKSEELKQPIWVYFFSSFVVAFIVFNGVWNYFSVLSLAAGIGALISMSVLFLFCKKRKHLWWSLIILILQIISVNF